MFLYWSLHALFSAALRVFFREIETEGLDAVSTTHPVLFVANHPNAMIDPLVVGTRLRRRVYLTAKSTFRRRPLYRLLMRLAGVILFYRDLDYRGTLALGRNATGFELCRQRLAEGDSIIIFPEAESHSELTLREFKRGAALIALRFAAVCPPGQEFHIVPVSLSYENKARFRSAVCVLFGEPIIYSAGTPVPEISAHTLTHTLEHRVAAMTLSYRSKTERKALPILAALSSSRTGCSRPWPLMPQRFCQQLQDMKQIQSNLSYEARASLRTELLRRAWRYDRRIRRWNLRPDDPLLTFRPASIVAAGLSNLLLLLLFLPLLALGGFAFGPSILAIRFTARLLTRDYEDWASNQIYPGILIISALLLLEIAMALLVLPRLLGLAFPFLVLASGFSLMQATDRVRQLERAVRILAHTWRNSTEMAEIRKGAQEILDLLQQLEDSSKTPTPTT